MTIIKYLTISLFSVVSFTSTAATLDEINERASRAGRGEPGSVLNTYSKPQVDFYSSGDSSFIGVNYDVSFFKHKATFGFSVPVTKGSDSTLGSLDGLAKYNRFSLGMQGVHFFPPEKSPIEINDVCNEIRVENKIDTNKPCDIDLLRKELEEKDNHKAIRKLNELERNSWGLGSLTYGVKGEVGQKKYKYLPSNDATDTTSEDKEGWSASAYLSLYDAINTVYSLEYKREVTYKENKTVSICNAPATPCLVGPLLAPKKNEVDLVAFQVRHRFDNDTALTVKLSHNFDTHDLTVEVPYYFFGNEKGMNGGIAAGWSQEDPGITFGLFVGQSFSLFD